MYTRGSTDGAKEAILQEFIKVETHLHIIIATTAFGMGIDCCDIKQVYHWGPPHTREEYVQECGRAGRNQESCSATLKPRGDITNYMARYGQNNTICCQKQLYNDFLFFSDMNIMASTLCMCCDICKISCKCTSCDK